MALATEAAAGERLYAAPPTIYARHVTGKFSRLRWLMVAITQLVFYGLPWMSWNGRQAVLFDIAARRFHVFGLVLWPQDFILLTGLLVCCALSLFLFTAVAGRLWCGYACPQTVYSSLFQWLERHTEGEWGARRHLDNAPWGPEKILRKGAKQISWLALSAWTGLTFVGYFTPIRSLVLCAATLECGSWETFWLGFYGLATYGNAGWMREQVCKYLCPYARFQGVMMDRETVTVTYQTLRGEPRGGRARSVDPRAAALGDCIDCHLCVQVCPTGIDIRSGLQIECINCGLCADACNGVMDRVGYARGLIGYTSEVVRPWWQRRRVLIYGALLVVVGGGLVSSLVLRNPVRLDVMRDRAVLARDTPDGLLENIYRLQVLNLSERTHHYAVHASGVPGLHLGGRDSALTVEGLATAQLAVDVDVDPAQLHASRTPITLEVEDLDEPGVRAASQTLFFRP